MFTTHTHIDKNLKIHSPEPTNNKYCAPHQHQTQSFRLEHYHFQHFGVQGSAEAAPSTYANIPALSTCADNSVYH